MDLSLIIPACNEQDRITQTLERFASYFPKIAKKFEMIIVVNGSADATLERALEFKRKHKAVKIINIPARVGKGGALISGFKKANYKIMGFLDADDAFELSHLSPMFESLKNNKADAAIASKWYKKRFLEVDEPFTRKVLSRGWNLLTKVLLSLPFADTQAGAKFFTKDAWNAISHDFVGRGFEFDADLLMRFRNAGMRIDELYIPNHYREQSKFKLTHSIGMFFRLISIALHKREQHPAYYYDAYMNWWHPTHIFYKRKIDWIMSFVPKGSAFLDAGCGSGVLSTIVSQKRGCKVTGIDIKADQVHYAKQLCPGCTFAQHDLKNAALGKTFDVVNCSDVVEHFDEKTRSQVLATLDRHVRSGGRLIIVCPSWFYIKIFEKFWKLVRKMMSPRTHFDDDDIHMVVSPASVKAFYGQRGYRLLKNGTFGFGLLNYVVMQKEAR